MQQKIQPRSLNIIFGKRGEDIVVENLIQQGYTILARNYKGSYGEIDIVARKESVTAFIEVKLRKSNAIILESLISSEKQRRITSMARLFIAKHMSHIHESVFRFDVALITYQKETGILEYNYIESAFASHE